MKSLKNTAKTQLSNNWSKAYAALALFLMVSLSIYLSQQIITTLLSDYGIITDTVMFDVALSDLGGFASSIINTILSKQFLFIVSITLFFVLIRFLIISPLQQGHQKWYYSAAKGSKTYMSKVFFYYRTNEAYMASLLFRIGVLLRSIIYGFLSFFAAIISLSLSVYQFYIYSLSGHISDRQKAILYIIVTVFMILLGAILFAFLMLKYFLATYIFSDINKFDGGFRQVNDCFVRSKKLMAGETSRVISFALSFVPALLSCVFIIPVFYVYPYFRCSLAVLAHDIISSAESDK